MYKSRGASSVERGALFAAAGALLQEEGHRCGGGVSIAAPDLALLCQMVPTAHSAAGETVCALAVIPAAGMTECRGGNLNLLNLMQARTKPPKSSAGAEGAGAGGVGGGAERGLSWQARGQQAGGRGQKPDRAALPLVCLETPGAGVSRG